MIDNAQQPGGLTDKAFAEDPQQSLRNRSWFTATWNIPALSLDVTIDSNNLFSAKAYGLVAGRKYVGVLSKIILPDYASDPRTVMSDAYRNVYTELRYLHRYSLIKSLKSSLAAGLRFYHGDTRRIQGFNYNGSDADFSIRTTDSLQIDYGFPSWNVAAFAENLFQLSPRLSVTPGARFEYLQTNANGYTVSDTATGVRTYGNERHTRSFPLLGIGLDYKLGSRTDLYANCSQNYSPVNFGDIIIITPDMIVDSGLKDVKGYNLDLGYRGQAGRLVHFDLSAYYLLYKNRVGTLLQIDGSSNVYQYTTNISDSRSLGTELYADLNLLQLCCKGKNSRGKLSLFGSAAYTDARYIHADGNPQRSKFENKKVEYAPQWICRTGLDAAYKKLSGSLQFSYTGEEFSDASNAPRSSDGTVGIIPSYSTLDFTADYNLRHWLVSFSINNLTDVRYFTRRATGFPGPGIIPSQGRAFYLTVQCRL